MNWRRIMGGRIGGAVAIVAVALAGILYAPAVLAFPFKRQIGATTIYAQAPIGPRIEQELARADGLLAASPIDVPGIERTIVLTDGGWRWRVLSIGVSGAIAFRRPFGSTLIFNRSDVATDRVTNNAALGGVRTLSGTIAHETTHMLITRHFGYWRSWRFPTWKVEGYADYVAQETSVGANDEAMIRAKYPDAPVLVYYEGRRRVAATLRANGGSVDRLFDRPGTGRKGALDRF